MRSTVVLLAASLFLCAVTSDARTVTPSPSSGTLKPQTMDRVTMELPGDSFSMISVSGDGKGDIDCYLYREAPPGKDMGDFVERDDSSFDGCVLGITARAPSERFLLLVQNASDHDEKYTVNVR